VQLSANRLRNAIKQDAFNANVIVKVFEMTQRLRCAANVQVKRGSRMRGE
jgi:hypothetical protein